MPYDAHKNFASSTVATAPSPATTGTSLVVAAGDGTKFPTPPFNVSIWPISAQPSTANAEIARCTARTTDTLTLTRAQESSTARSVVIGDQIAATITAKTLTDLETALSYGTTLPAAPVDGQEAILVDSTTNPTYQWRFRYNAGSSSAYKWECVGGGSIVAETAGTDTTTSASTANLTNGPSIVLPRAGDWLIRAGAVAANPVVSGQNFLGVGDSAIAANLVTGITMAQSAVAGYWTNPYLESLARGVGAVTLTLKAWGTGAGTMSYQYRRLAIQPIRVS